MGAPPPAFIAEHGVLHTPGEDAVYYQTRLCGASNANANRELHFASIRVTNCVESNHLATRNITTCISSETAKL
jgi:hypothetical protein